jgi:hypothetical protein
MDGAPPTWLAALVPLFFAGIFYFVLLILSTVGGWTRLAESYPDDVPAEGITFRWQSAQFGLANYGRCLNITVDHARFRLSAVWLFRLAHPPISIPWGDIRVERGRSWFMEVGTFRFARAPGVTVRMKRRLVDRIVDASHGQLRIQPVGGGAH